MNIAKINNKELTKSECKGARIRIEKYHKEKLAKLQQQVAEALEECRNGKLNEFDVDHVIHIYHKQSQGLNSFINTYYHATGCYLFCFK
jgi:hypothetical protein